jgi:hypothetical protein
MKAITSLALVAAVVLAACSFAPVPPPTASHATPLTKPSTPTPAPGGPTVSCEPAADSIGTDDSGSPIPVTLTCDKAVAAAEAALGPDPGIASIEFHYRYLCPPGNFCVVTTENDGHVIFHLTRRRPDIVVQIHTDQSGRVIASSPQPVRSPGS